MPLRAHQEEPARKLLALAKAGHNAVDLSDTGVGKTYSATWVARELMVPTLAVVPLISVTAWEQASASFGDKISIIGYEKLRTGRSGAGIWENTPPPGFKQEKYFKCQCCQLMVDLNNYSPCYCHPAGIHCVETKKKAWNYGNFIFNPSVRYLIFDEAHRCAGDSLNADMMIAAKRQGITTLALSATLADGPLNMRALGYLLGLHGLKNFYNWTRRYGCGSLPGVRGWHWLAGKDKQKEVMLKLNKEIIPARGVRVRTSDIPGFPKRTVTAELFDLDEAGQISALYEEMCDALTLLQKHMDGDKDGEHPLTKLLRTRQKIELLKVPLAVELARDYVAKGNSVGIFVNFKQTMEELRRRLACDCFIDGSPEGRQNRQQSIDRFNADEARTIMVNNDAGGVAVSLPDTRGEFLRVGLVMPPSSARTFKQLIGRFHRESAVSPCFYKVLLAARTADVGIHRKLMLKTDNLDTLNDGDFSPLDTTEESE